MNVAMANQKLFQLKRLYDDQQWDYFIPLLKQIAQGCYQRSDMDVLWQHVGELMFQLVVLRQLVKDPKRLLTLKQLQITLQKFADDEISLDADLVIKDATVQWWFLDRLNTILLVADDHDTFQQVQTVSAAQLKYFIDHHDDDDETSIHDPNHQVSFNSETDTVKPKIIKLLAKYQFSNTRPYVFSASEEPQVNLKKLQRWADHNGIVVSIRDHDGELVCNIEARFFALYQKLYVR